METESSPVPESREKSLSGQEANGPIRQFREKFVRERVLDFEPTGSSRGVHEPGNGR